MIYRNVKLIILFTASMCNLQAQDSSFPSDWIGLWAGNLEIYSGLTLVNSIPMTLAINPLDTVGNYTYHITYGEDEDALRPYILRTVDAAKGQYVLDEDNGILINMFLLGNTLVSSFEVQNSFLQTRSYLENSFLHYEIIAGTFTADLISGDTIIGSDTIPPVQSFPLGVLQKAELSRIE